MVVSKAPLTCGVAAEIAARISGEGVDFLEQPVLRLGAEDIPISVSAELETGTVPSMDLIEQTAIRKLE